MDETGNSCIEKYYKTRFNCMQEDIFIIFMNEKNFIIFIIFSVLGLLLNDLIMHISIDKFNIYYMLSKIIATAIVMIFNFVTRKLFLE